MRASQTLFPILCCALFLVSAALDVSSSSSQGTEQELRWIDKLSFDLYNQYGDRWLIIFGLFIYMGLYSLVALVYMFLEYKRMFPQYRIQPGIWAKPEDYKHVIIHLLKVIFFGMFPAAYFGAPYLETLGITANKLFPSYTTFAMHVFACWVIEDIFQYFLHRLLHYGWFYKAIHKKHHDYQAPFAFAATYAHPVEVIVLGFCSFAGPFLLKTHLFTLVFWMIVQQTDACIRHSGYDFPYDPCKLIPMYGGAKFHDAHHEVFIHNYASRFVWLDMMFGTYKDPKDLVEKHRQREAKLKASGKGA